MKISSILGVPKLSRLYFYRSRGKYNAYLEGIYNTVVVKDVEERDKRKHEDKNKRKVTDITLLKTISKYLAGVV